MRLVQERDRLRAQHEDLANAERLAQQLAKNLEREKEGILATYKKACEENERLTLSFQTMNEE
jgi:flagellar motility protein MotE (MotC chaperone)